MDAAVELIVVGVVEALEKDVGAGIVVKDEGESEAATEGEEYDEDETDDEAEDEDKDDGFA
jgi:hypothetical protein